MNGGQEIGTVGKSIRSMGRVMIPSSSFVSERLFRYSTFGMLCLQVQESPGCIYIWVGRQIPTVF